MQATTLTAEDNWLECSGAVDPRVSAGRVVGVRDIENALGSISARVGAAVNLALQRSANRGRGVILRLTAPGPPMAACCELAGEFSGDLWAWASTADETLIIGSGALKFDAASDYIAQLRDCSDDLEQMVEVGVGGAQPAVPVALFDGDFSTSDNSVQALDAPFMRGGVTVPEQLFCIVGTISSRASLWLVDARHHTADFLVQEVLRAATSLVQEGGGPGRMRPSEVVTNTPAAAQTLARVVPDESREDWVARVRSAKEAISEGRFDKVVMARAATAVLEPGLRFCPVKTFLGLRSANRASYIFLHRRSDGRAFVGASPELLIRRESSSIRTVALAGTTARGCCAAEDEALGKTLLASSKERSEHSLVVSAIVEALTPFCAELEVPEVPATLRLPRLQHLETPICGRLSRDVGFHDLVGLLHPTPAVGGWPQRAALRWLRENEPLQRGFYAAPIGWLGRRGNGTAAVAIRSALIEQNRARLFAGAGIVADSDPEGEWRETRLKLDTVRSELAVLLTSPSVSGVLKEQS